MTEAGSVLLQYGALGAIALLAIYAVAKLFSQNKAASDAAVAAANARADRLEKQLADLNATMIERVLPATIRLTDALARTERP
jgi:hypothetical protein